MRYIGNIISKSDKYKFNRFINVTDKFDVNMNIPTLIVGISNTEQIIGKERMNYINRVCGDNLFWTFATTEKRSDNERDVEKFKKLIINNLKSQVGYQFFNVLTCTNKRFRNFLKFLNNDIKKYYYFTDKMLYIAYENTVIGVSLEDCEYVGVTKRKIYDKLKKHNKKFIFESTFLTEDEKSFFNDDEILIAAMFCYANS